MKAEEKTVERAVREAMNRRLSGLQSSEREVRKKALDDLVRIRRYDTMTDVNEEDQILLLITCVGDDDERLIVAARRLREGEKEDQLQMK